jgi:cytochrome bd-type quinol oxidase subunit 2
MAATERRDLWKWTFCVCAVGFPMTVLGTVLANFRLGMPSIPDELPTLQFWFRFWLGSLALTIVAGTAVFKLHFREHTSEPER